MYPNQKYNRILTNSLVKFVKEEPLNKHNLVLLQILIIRHIIRILKINLEVYNITKSM